MQTHQQSSIGAAGKYTQGQLSLLHGQINGNTPVNVTITITMTLFAVSPKRMSLAGLQETLLKLSGTESTRTMHCHYHTDICMLLLACCDT